MHTHLALSYFEEIKDYADRNSITFPHHFGQFLLEKLDEIDENIEAMKEGFLQRLEEKQP